jgi:hypothetical protein
MRLGEGPESHTRNLPPRRLIQYSAGDGKRGVRRQDHSEPLADEGKLYTVEEQYQSFIYSVNLIFICSAALRPLTGVSTKHELTRAESQEFCVHFSLLLVRQQDPFL